MKINPIDILKQLGEIPFDKASENVQEKIKNTMNNATSNNSDNPEAKAIRQKAADSVIRNHIIWSMGTGLIPLPVVDFLAVSAVKLDMVRQLSKLYAVDFKETEGKAVITTLTTSGLAQLGSKAAIKFIPGVGTVVGGVTMAVLAGAGTYALGEVFKEHFETGGTFLDFDPERLRKYYQEKFEKGKKVAEQMREEQAREKANHRASQKAAQKELQKQEGEGNPYNNVEDTINEGLKKVGNFFKINRKKKADKNAVDPLEVNEADINTNTEDANVNIDDSNDKLEDAADLFETSTKEEAPIDQTVNNKDDLQTLVLAKIKELANLRDADILSDEEFQQMKKKVLEKFKIL